MKRTLRFKRVAPKLKKPIPTIGPVCDDDGTQPIQPLETNSTPISELPIDKMTILPSTFFQIDALDLAPRLLGKFLRRDDVVLQITEVEAYRPNDSACHGRFGVTARTAPIVRYYLPTTTAFVPIIEFLYSNIEDFPTYISMLMVTRWLGYLGNIKFGAGGHAYVYLCYGLHAMLNVVADKEGVGAAVLIRSCAPISGLQTVQHRRGQKTDKPVLLTGPGKVGQALGLSTEWSNHPLYTPGGLEILDGPVPEKMLIGPRVGIEYALPEHANALWRFAIGGTPWISAPKNTLRPHSSYNSCPKEPKNT